VFSKILSFNSKNWQKISVILFIKKILLFLIESLVNLYFVKKSSGIASLSIILSI
jgi:hypothetical protein